MITELSYDFYNSPDPSVILDTLKQMRKAPNRHEIFFDREDLDHVAQAWERAAIAGVGDLQFIAEKQKFLNFRDRVIAEEKEHKTWVRLMLEPRDWPSPRLIDRAIQRLRHAQIRTFH